MGGCLSAKAHKPHHSNLLIARSHRNNNSLMGENEAKWRKTSAALKARLSAAEDDAAKQVG